MRPALRLAGLTVLWIVLWRDLSLANAVSGLAVAVAVTLLYPMAPARVHRHRVRPGALLVFLAHFAWKMVLSNLVVARAILSPRHRIRTGILEVPLEGRSDLVTTVIANAITLTPGSMTIDVRESPRRLYVHVLHLTDIEDVRQDILELVRLALRAFDTEELVAELDRAESAVVAGSRAEARDGGGGDIGGIGAGSRKDGTTGAAGGPDDPDDPGDASGSGGTSVEDDG